MMMQPPQISYDETTRKFKHGVVKQGTYMHLIWPRRTSLTKTKTNSELLFTTSTLVDYKRRKLMVAQSQLRRQTRTNANLHREQAKESQSALPCWKISMIYNLSSNIMHAKNLIRLI